MDGRSHIHIQTDNYLEELTDKLPEEDNSTQTDAWMDLPQLPLFIPTKTGVDKATQIEEGDLFDFDVEVNPILEVLVGKALEHSMNEVLEEEELAAIRRHQREYEHLRNLEIAEVKRLEAEAARRHAEKERRMDQERARLAREAEVSEKLSARKYAKEYLTDLHSNVFENLMEAGVFYDPLEKVSSCVKAERDLLGHIILLPLHIFVCLTASHLPPSITFANMQEVGEIFMPSLLSAAAKKCSSKTAASALARGLVMAAAKKLQERRQAVYDRIAKERAEEEARLAAELEQAEAEAKAAEEAEEKDGDGGE